MGKRSQIVSRERKESFEWILGESEDNRPSEGANLGYVAGLVNHGSEMRSIRMALELWLPPGHPASIFWITGKPGSGKSTLAKAIREHGNLSTRLQVWARGSDYIVAEHFFWIAGHPLQRSLTSMFQALLHGILTELTVAEDLALLKRICGTQWTSRQLHCPWSHGELKQSLSRACRPMAYTYAHHISNKSWNWDSSQAP